MAGSKIAIAAISLWAALGGSSVSNAQVAYIPPSAERPRFGGEFDLTQLGPVAGYWPTECRTWQLRNNEHRDAPLATPELRSMFDRFVSGVINEKPNYGDLSPAMAQAVRKNLPTYWASLNRMGEASAAKQIATDEVGNTVYVVDQKGGATHWNIAVNPQGKIEVAFICKGQGA